MAEFYCRHCTKRFIGEGRGSGQVRLQCRECGRWQWVKLQEIEDKAQRLARVAV